MKKRIIALVLTAAMTIGFSTTVFAGGDPWFEARAALELAALERAGEITPTPDVNEALVASVKGKGYAGWEQKVAMEYQYTDPTIAEPMAAYVNNDPLFEALAAKEMYALFLKSQGM